jgi:hypothetical protein
MRDATTFVFGGRFDPASFVEFMHHRARRLALRAGVDGISYDRIEVSVSGEADLLDAFELACSLGPLDCLVLDVLRAHRNESVGPTATKLPEAPA